MAQDAGEFRVLAADGRAAAGATVVIVRDDQSITVREGKVLGGEKCVSSVADAEGVAHVVAPATRHVVLAVSTEGSVVAKPGTHVLRLVPWAGLDGRVIVAGKPAKDRAVIAWDSGDDDGEYDPHAPSIFFESAGTTDPDGHYRLTMLPPTKLDVALNDRFSWGTVSRPLKSADLRSMPVSINFGEVGATVRGRITLPEWIGEAKDLVFRYGLATLAGSQSEPPMPEEIKRETVVEQAAWAKRFEASEEGRKFKALQDAMRPKVLANQFPFDLSPDGTFRIAYSVPPATYTLSGDFYSRGPDGRPLHHVARLKGTFTVPPTAGAAEIDIGDFAATRVFELSVGDEMADFDVPTLDGGRVRLSDLRGKYVLIDFWATWCGPCVGETDNVKATYAAYGSDHRFAIVNLSMDMTPDKPIAYVAQHGLTWTQGFLGYSSKVFATYGLVGIPQILLVGPDGKVIAINLRGDKIKDAVRKALDQTANPVPPATRPSSPTPR